MSVSLTVILDTRRIKKRSAKYPLKLRVTSERIPQYYPTIYDLTEEEYKKLSASRISEQLQTIKRKIIEIERSSSDIAFALDPFTFIDFERSYILNNPLFIQKQNIKNNIIAEVQKHENYDYTPYLKKFPILTEPPASPDTFAFIFSNYIKKLILEERIGTAANYHCAYNSFKKFSGNVKFQTITVSYLNQYEQWAKQGGMSKTTIGIYTRGLRAIFNEAIENGIIKKEKCYPFGRRRYQIPSSRNIKKALNLEAIEKIFNYAPSCSSERKAKAFWIFCYLGNGINPKDIALLKYKNIHEDYIIFERAKTERTSRSDLKQISIYMTEEIVQIIREYGNKDTDPDNFIFPILEKGLTPLDQYLQIQLLVRFINDWMIKICSNLNIDKRATTYVARHSFATILKRSGASTEFIKEALGHQDLRTTEKYLDSFGNELKREYAFRLTPFKNKEEVL